MIRLMNVNRFMHEPASFVADGVEDLKILPTTTAANAFESPVPFGARCFVIETDEVYRLKSDDTWVLTPTSGYGLKIGIATEPEVAEMLDDVFAF